MTIFDDNAGRMVTAQQAIRLAVSYEGYFDASARNSLNGIAVWAGLLLSDQRDTGIELIANDTLQQRIDYAKRALAEAGVRAFNRDAALDALDVEASG